MAALMPVRLAARPDDDAEQVRQLHQAGMEIGGHTVNHPIIARLPAPAARQEIADGKAALEAMIGAPVRLFAYPNGKPGQDYQAEHVAMVKQLGFDAAVSTSWGAARAGSDLFQLPRFTPWDRDQLRFTLRMMKNLAFARRHGLIATRQHRACGLTSSHRCTMAANKLRSQHVS